MIWKGQIDGAVDQNWFDLADTIGRSGVLQVGFSVPGHSGKIEWHEIEGSVGRRIKGLV